MARRAGWPTVRLGAAARVFAVVSLLAPALWTRDVPAIVALLAIGAVWAVGVAVELDSRVPAGPAVVAESVAVGVVCGLSLPESVAAVGALAVGPFVAGLRRGRPGAATALISGIAAAFLVATATAGLPGEAADRALVSSAVAGIGFGLIASFLHTTLRRDPDPLAPYHDARELVRELIAVSDGLTSSLDPTVLGTTLLDQVRDELPATALTLYVPNDRELTPLVASTTEPATDLRDVEVLALRCRIFERAVTERSAFAFPVTVGSTVTGIVAGRLSDRVDPVGLGLLRRVRELGPDLAGPALLLDTALLFARLRDRATTVERHRLAREIHDGLAQDIASLGYLVDALAAVATSPEQAVRIDALRARITSVVAEVRRSVVTLRTGTEDAASLGAALATVARRLTESAGVPIHVTADEQARRLRPEVEAELFRIAQQAVTNAVRHSGATTIDVHCHVRPPRAVITVRDDGRGLQPARADSQGLAIMRERAALIGAQLEIERRHPHGTIVTVHLAPSSPPPAIAPVAPQQEATPV